MDVSPEAKRFTEIYTTDTTDLAQVREQFDLYLTEHQIPEPPVTVLAESKERLQKLQDDLRKAGYKKLR